MLSVFNVGGGCFYWGSGLVMRSVCSSGFVCIIVCRSFFFLGSEFSIICKFDLGGFGRWIGCDDRCMGFEMLRFWNWLRGFSSDVIVDLLWRLIDGNLSLFDKGGEYNFGDEYGEFFLGIVCYVGCCIVIDM